MNIKIFVLLSNYLVQGMRYMTWGERAYKISITFGFVFLLYTLTGYIYFSLFFGHFLNYLLNGQFFVVFRYLASSEQMSVQRLIWFLGLVEPLAKRFNCRDVMVTGSFCRGAMRGTSDLDLRVYHSPNLIMSLQAYMYATVLRFLGLVNGFPVDVFCFSNMKFLDKLDVVEVPCYTFGDKKFLARYPMSISVNDNLKRLKFEEE